MSASMELRENGHVVYAKFVDPWTLEELEMINANERKHRDESNFIVHSLVDVRNMHKIPPGLLTVARRTPSFTHPLRGHMAIVGATAYAQALVEVLARVTRRIHTKFFRTEEEAMTYLRQIIAEEAAKELSKTPEDIPSSGASDPASQARR